MSDVEPLFDLVPRSASGAGPASGIPASGIPAGGSRPPFEPGNQAARTHGFYATARMREEDRAEVEAIAAIIAEGLPDYRASFAIQVWQLALKLWRQARAYGYLSERGSIRDDGSTQPLLIDLAKLENGIARDVDALGLNPRSMGALGLDVARTGSELDRYLAEHYPADPAEAER